MSINLKNTLIYISIIGILLFGILPISYAKNSNSIPVYRFVFSHLNTIVKKAESTFYAFKQIPDEPTSSSSEETEDLENLQEEFQDNNLLYFNSSIVFNHLDNEIKVQLDNLMYSIQQTPKVSLFILFHSWKSHQA